MKKDTETTDVIFRKYKTEKAPFFGDILAIFPYCIADYQNNVQCYQHTGQHSAGDYLTCIQMTTPANETEYTDLKKELETAFGYNLKVVKRMQYKKFQKAIADEWKQWEDWNKKQIEKKGFVK